MSLFQDKPPDVADVVDVEGDSSTPTLTGDEQETSSVMSELDLRQGPQPAEVGWPERTPVSPRASNRSNHTNVHVPEKCVGGSCSSLFSSRIPPDTTLHDTREPTLSASSTASVSDLSDDGSLRSSLSNPCSIASFRGALQDPLTSSPSSTTSSISGPPRKVAAPAGGAKRSNPRSTSLCPRPVVGTTTDALNSLARFTAAHARSTATSGPGAPILPLMFMPNFHAGAAGGEGVAAGGGSGGGNPSSVTAPASRAISTTLPALGSLHPATVLSAATGAASQALAAGWKRLREGEAVNNGGGGSCGGDNGLPKSEARERPFAAVSTGGSATGAGSAARDPEAMDAVPPSVRKRAKREERLMKNREAANRSRIKVCAAVRHFAVNYKKYFVFAQISHP